MNFVCFIIIITILINLEGYPYEIKNLSAIQYKSKENSERGFYSVDEGEKLRASRSVFCFLRIVPIIDRLTQVVMERRKVKSHPLIM